MNKSLLFVLTLGMLASACSPYVKYTPGKNISDLQSPNIRTGENTLPSGRKIVTSSIDTMDFPRGPSALVLSYTTTTPIENKKDLRAEVDEVFQLFVKDVEAAGLQAAALRPVNGQKGYGFLFQKRDDGNWHCLDDEK